VTKTSQGKANPKIVNELLKEKLKAWSVMEFKQPQWHLKNAICEICEGQGWLVFQSCPTCGCIVLECDEDGTVYKNPSSQKQHTVYGNCFDENCVCPNCKYVRLFQFRNSTSDEIIQLGFVAGEYE
jgi:hypothetical protein